MAREAREGRSHRGREGGSPLKSAGKALEGGSHRGREGRRPLKSARPQRQLRHTLMGGLGPIFGVFGYPIVTL